MKQIVPLLILLLNCLAISAQERIEAKDTALLEKLAHDKTVIIMHDGFKSIDLSTNNINKQKLYLAYLNKKPSIIKMFSKDQAGLEGQYTKTYFIVDHGKVQIVQAYYGDPSGSDRLRYIHTYEPQEIKLGYFDKEGNFISVSNTFIPKDKYLIIRYLISKELEPQMF